MDRVDLPLERGMDEVYKRRVTDTAFAVRRANDCDRPRMKNAIQRDTPHQTAFRRGARSLLRQGWRTHVHTIGRPSTFDKTRRFTRGP